MVAVVAQVGVISIHIFILVVDILIAVPVVVGSVVIDVIVCSCFGGVRFKYLWE